MNDTKEDTQIPCDILTSNLELPDVDNAHRSLGEAIPEELFSNILASIGHNYCDLREANPRQKYDIPREILTELRHALCTCALVSRHWANHCRLYMFGGATIWISSLDHARWFREYSLHGSPRIRKVCDLIKMLRIRQSYDEPRSFLDLVYMPVMRHKLDEVMITGPTPANFPPSIIDTPHWRLTNMAYPSPAITAYTMVSLDNITFPSFLHLVKYIKYFRAALTTSLRGLKWNDKVPLFLPRPTPTCSRRLKFSVVASECTDSFLVGWYVSAMYVDSTVHTVLERDQQWAMNIMMFLRDHYEGLKDDGNPCRYVFAGAFSQNDRVVSFGVSAYKMASNFPGTAIHFVCDSKPRSPGIGIRGSPRTMPIVGVVLTIASTSRRSLQGRRSQGSIAEQHTPDLTRLRIALEQRCALRSVIITFGSYPVLKIAVKRYPLLLEPWPHGCDYRLACERDDRHNFLSDVPHPANSGSDIYVEIDPTTLKPTGQYWTHSFDFLSSLLTGVR